MWLSPGAPARSSCVVSVRVEGTLSSRPSFHRELDVPLPDIDYVEIPVDWWDAEADKSLLIGVFKHGVYFSACFLFPGKSHRPVACLSEKVEPPLCPLRSLPR